MLDLGTGSGVLAIAAAKRLRARVTASDIDRVAVEAARGNARLNRAGAAITFVRAAGTNARPIARGAPYDLIFANILLGPLSTPGGAGLPARRPKRAHRAVRPVARPRQCRARDLSRAGARAPAAHSARWLGHFGAEKLLRLCTQKTRYAPRSLNAPGHFPESWLSNDLGQIICLFISLPHWLFRAEMCLAWGRD